MTRLSILALTVLITFLFACKKDKDHPSAGFVFTMSNQIKGNSLIAFTRHPDGTLSKEGSLPTGGLGTGGGLGNQGALSLSESAKWLFVVNPGSDDFSVFKINPSHVELVGTTPSGGSRPISITSHKNMIYVLNAGGNGNIAGFYINHAGQTTAIPNSVKPLSGSNTGPAQISFSSDGRSLVVTEKMTNLITTYKLDHAGVPVSMHTKPSASPTPFGFAVGRNHIYVSEANGGTPDQSALTSYRVNNGLVSLSDGPESTTETAACWVVITHHEKYAYVTNTGSHTISGYRIGFGGQIELLDSDGVTAHTGAGSAPIDEALSHHSRFLYTLNSGNNSISAFEVNQDGSLRFIENVYDLPSGTNGLVAH